MNKYVNLMASAALGKFETAKIICHDYRNSSADGNQAILQNEKDKDKQNDLFIINSVDKMFQQSHNDVSADFGAISQNNKINNVHKKAETRIYTVQFNPSKLTIDAASLAIDKSDASNALAEQRSAVSPILRMTTYLNFDAMRTGDAFLWDKYRKFSASETITASSSAMYRYYKDNLEKDDLEIADTGDTTFARLSVQPHVEGFIAALRNPYTRCISFRWADFCFTGNIEAVTAQYTMFSPAGHPIRAQVMIRLCQETNASTIRPWIENFNAIFSKEEVYNLVNSEQHSSSILNMGI